ncbi:MAG TPA: hypothetical protein VMJ35_06275 [Dongiaceae bacterium]|nr:hypothetical protein [Dongiaceae bacterium]
MGSSKSSFFLKRDSYRGASRLSLSLVLFVPLSLLFAGELAAQESANPSETQFQTAAKGRTPAPPSPQGAARRVSSAVSPSLVAFEEGQLSINASNVSLAEVLFAVRSATGADIDIPVNANSERVTAQLGPGPARKVLSDLLGWSNFDYIIQGADDDPLAVHSITLMERIKGGANASGPISASLTGRTGSAAPPRPDPEPAAASMNEPGAAAESHQDQPAAAGDNLEAPPPAQPKGTNIPPTMPWGTGSAAGKSPSDMAQELQQMYQQRRVMQEQQNQATGQRSP